jgi:hypothetical protein
MSSRRGRYRVWPLFTMLRTPRSAGVTRLISSGETPRRREHGRSRRGNDLVQGESARGVSNGRVRAVGGRVRQSSASSARSPEFPLPQISVRGKVPIWALSAYTDLPPSPRRRRPGVPPWPLSDLDDEGLGGCRTEIVGGAELDLRCLSNRRRARQGATGRQLQPLRQGAAHPRVRRVAARGRQCR